MSIWVTLTTQNEHFLSSKVKPEAISSSSNFRKIPVLDSQMEMCQNAKLLGNKKIHKELLSNLHPAFPGFYWTHYLKTFWNQADLSVSKVLSDPCIFLCTTKQKHTLQSTVCVAAALGHSRCSVWGHPTYTIACSFLPSVWLPKI